MITNVKIRTEEPTGTDISVCHCDNELQPGAKEGTDKHDSNQQQF